MEWRNVSSAECIRSADGCTCEPPFKLFPLPTKLQYPEIRVRWLKLLKRQDPNGKKWDPIRNARICSDHFPDGYPTPEIPDPILQLGYKSTSGTKRKSPKLRAYSQNMPVCKNPNWVQVHRPHKAVIQHHRATLNTMYPHMNLKVGKQWQIVAHSNSQVFKIMTIQILPSTNKKWVTMNAQMNSAEKPLKLVNCI